MFQCLFLWSVCTHTHTLSLLHTRTHTCKRTHKHICALTLRRTHTHTQTPTYPDACACTHTHRHTHTHTHTLTHVHTAYLLQQHYVERRGIKGQYFCCALIVNVLRNLLENIGCEVKHLHKGENYMNVCSWGKGHLEQNWDAEISPKIPNKSETSTKDNKFQDEHAFKEKLVRKM